MLHEAAVSDYPFFNRLLAAGMTYAHAELNHVDVSTTDENGYHTYRIPSVTTAPDGSLIAIVEGRKHSSFDPGRGNIELVYKRSSAGGMSWSSMMIFDDPGDGWDAANPTTVVDAGARSIITLFIRWEPGRGTRNSQPGTNHNQTWLRYSDDNGVTWSRPREITRQARDFEKWGAIFVGSGSGIQTRTGRLIIPATRKLEGTSDLTGTQRSYMLYSDDGGANWQRGQRLGVLSNEN